MDERVEGRGEDTAKKVGERERWTRAGEGENKAKRKRGTVSGWSGRESVCVRARVCVCVRVCVCACVLCVCSSVRADSVGVLLHLLQPALQLLPLRGGEFTAARKRADQPRGRACDSERAAGSTSRRLQGTRDDLATETLEAGSHNAS